MARKSRENPFATVDDPRNWRVEGGAKLVGL